MTRPSRMRIANELGQPRTLPDDAPGASASGVCSLPSTFEVLAPCTPNAGGLPPEVLVLGAGPNPATALRAVRAALAVAGMAACGAAGLGPGTTTGAATGTTTGTAPCATSDVSPEAWSDATPNATPNVPNPAPVGLVECPKFAHHMDAAWRSAIPAEWGFPAPADLSPARLARALLVIYREGERLFPSFWGPILGMARAVRLRPGPARAGEGPDAPCRAMTPAPRGPHGQCSASVLLPGTEHSLLLPELEAALLAEGLQPRRVSPDAMHAELPRLLADERPAMLLSVNLQGLDAWGERYHLLRACGVPVVIWCVDNPFHLLSALRGPWWREAHLCVTDASFIPLLQAHGARQVQHLPLATWPELFGPEWFGPELLGSGTGRPEMSGHKPSAQGPVGHESVEPKAPARQEAPHEPGQPPECAAHLEPVVFVGRSAFPGREGFFASQRLPDTLRDEARTLLDSPGQRPDFHWWAHRLGLDALWPGNAVRAAGLGAEECAQARRVRTLCAASAHGLTVFGDNGWRNLLPHGTDLRPPVDYYTTLPALYRAARWSLNVTSLLLPAGLTQRHFDVWAAGGFCITDDTPGLSIFPEELYRCTVFSPALRKGDAPRQSTSGNVQAPALDDLLAGLERDTSLRADLAAAWRSHIRAHHTYRHRVRAILDALRT